MLAARVGSLSLLLVACSSGAAGAGASDAAAGFDAAPPGWPDAAADAPVSPDHDAATPRAGCALSLLYGHGAAVLANNWSSAELAARMSCDGAPAAGRSVEWSLVDGSGGLSEGASAPIASSLETETDADGIARVVYRHPSGFDQPSWSNVAGRIEARVDDSVVSFFATAFNPGQQSPMLPHAQIVIPEGGGNYADLGAGKAGSVLPGALKVVVANSTGVEAGQGVPNIGIRLFGAHEGDLHCMGEAHTALTSSDGIAVCDLELPATPGEYVFDLDVGRVLAWKSLRVTVVP